MNDLSHLAAEYQEACRVFVELEKEEAHAGAHFAQLADAREKAWQAMKEAEQRLVEHARGAIGQGRGKRL